MAHDLLELGQLGRADLALVGGKAAHLGELSRLEGVRVPPGFCVTTEVFARLVGSSSPAAIEALVLPGELVDAVATAYGRLGADAAVAVRSSATAEDSPSASFAGQHESFLNVVGLEAVLTHIKRCWASLFSERALGYRLRNGLGPGVVRMAVVVQRMVAARAAGVMFTADPVSGDRRVVSIEATTGLADALVAGQVTPEGFKVRGEDVIARPATPAVLSDEVVLRLARLGRRVEAHFAQPQDLEWCLTDDGEVALVQSRPITTLFPVPRGAGAGKRVYLSVGHQQMMTEALRPLGRSLFQRVALRPMFEAGSRLFVDVTAGLGLGAMRAMLLEGFGRADPLIRDALETVLARGEVPLAGEGTRPPAPPLLEADPALVDELIAQSQASVAALRRDAVGRSGSAALELVFADVEVLKQRLAEPRSVQALMSGFEATWWLNDRMAEWLGEKNAADVLTQSVPNNVTSEMGLSLLDVADALRGAPDAVAQLERGVLPEGVEALDAWLTRYGMRCVGEIDVTRPRWREAPATLSPLILANLRNFAPGEARRRFARGLAAAQRKEAELLARVRALPDGAQRAAETKQMIDRVRTFIGYREYPKYELVSRFAVYRELLLGEAARLVAAGALRAKEDAFFLTLEELAEVVRSGSMVDPALLNERKEAFRVHQGLTPPRVLTSDGECVAGAYRREVPRGALVGLAVSAGVVEGRARVLRDVGEVALEPGDILVTTGTDPSWTPAFVAIAGLVTEVGGQMTHGAVIAREYGVPAVVGVERATQLIRDGQRLRVHGAEGFVELID